MPSLTLGDDSLQVMIDFGDDGPPALTAVQRAGHRLELARPQRLVEVLTLADGRHNPSPRLARTTIGAALRGRGHDRSADGSVLRLELAEPGGLAAEVELRVRPGIATVTSVITVRNGTAEPIWLTSVPSFCAALTGRLDDADLSAGELEILSGASDWLGEFRWSRVPARGLLVGLDSPAHQVAGKGAFVQRSKGTWSTGAELPTGGLVDTGDRWAWLWQVEHNGGWRWELGDDQAGLSLAAGGPTEADHQWSQRLAPGEEFRTVPVTLAVGAGFDDAVAQLTEHRRAARRDHPDNRNLTLIFNDYMNTLSGDPTTEKLLPLIDSAAAAGAEAFCIDAGWYADDGNWWDTVGEWQPSTSRFPGGFAEVIGRIRDRGMIPGVWLEPEVIGVNSPMADRLPEAAFFSRHGVRIREAGRYHLDLRHPAARDHLDRTVDRLVDGLGIGMFKFDYNVDPGPGTDLGADSAGAGLLAHNRAHLSWLDGLLHRHPELIIENCGSGAMRCDFAILSRLQLQSTSDQQDVARYVPIAASAPLQLLPEQAGSWAYPADWMSLEETAATLQAGLLGRLYLSGYLHRLSAEQQALVHRAVAVHKELRSMINSAAPSWPLGLPGWDEPQVALRLTGPDASLITVWHRGAEPAELNLPLAGPAVTALELIFPSDLDAWAAELIDDGRSLRLTTGPGPIAARTFRLSH